MANPYTTVIEMPQTRFICSRCGDHGATLDGRCLQAIEREVTFREFLERGVPCSCAAGGQFVVDAARWMEVA